MADIITPPEVTSDPLDISDLTEKTLAGAGVLDGMLQTMRVHLGDQFDKERIQGTEYADVYLGAFQATLNAAIQFLVTKRKLGLDLQLQQAQIDLTTAQEDQIRAEMQKIPLEMLQLEAQTSLINKQIEQADKQLELLEAQINVQLKQLDLLTEQVEQAKAQTAYYEQKTVTEKAQTDASVIGAGSVTAVQIDLMKAQEEGYSRNAEQQAAQIFANTWNVRRQTDEDTSANTTNLLDDTSVGKTMQALAAGIGVILTPA
jgi:hypothetical protein